MAALTVPLSHASDLFTAICDLENLFDTEAFLIENLENYMSNEQVRFDNLKKHLSYYKKVHGDAVAVKDRYLLNPINAFLMTKRLTSGWKLVEEQIHDEGESNLRAHNPVDGRS